MNSSRPTITGYGEASLGADGYDALTADDQPVQIKTNYAATRIGFRDNADSLLVIRGSDDGTWGANLLWGVRFSERESTILGEGQQAHHRCRTA